LDFTRSFNGSYWIYPEIVALNKYKIMIYSGNTDLCGSYYYFIIRVYYLFILVPITGTRMWLNQLRREAGLGLI